MPERGHSALVSSLQTYRPEDVARAYGVAVKKVLAWLRSGELTGINVGNTRGRKWQRWRIRPADLERFEARRQNGPQTAAGKAHRRAVKNRDPNFVDFFPK